MVLDEALQRRHKRQSLIDTLRGFTRERFVVYGFDRTDVEANLEFRAFSANGFLDDLACCRAVVATAGFTLMTEALYLRKPYLALPMRGQFEQELNAIMLSELGYGKNGREESAESIGDFLYGIPEYEDRLREYDPGDNGAIERKLDELCANDCALAQEYHRRRSRGPAR